MKNIFFILCILTTFACSEVDGTTKLPDEECETIGEEISCHECDDSDQEGIQTCTSKKVWSECVCENEATGGTGGNDQGTGGEAENTGGSDTTTGGNNSGGSDTGGGQNTGGADPSTGGSDTGGNGTGGSDTCIPKTCDEVSIELTGQAGLACGEPDDGCGGTLWCELSCNGDANAQCVLEFASELGIKEITDEGQIIPEYTIGDTLPNTFVLNTCKSDFGGNGTVEQNVLDEFCPPGEWDTLFATTRNNTNDSTPYVPEQILNEYTVLLALDTVQQTNYTYWCAIKK